MFYNILRNKIKIRKFIYKIKMNNINITETKENDKEIDKEVMKKIEDEVEDESTFNLLFEKLKEKWIGRDIYMKLLE